MTDTHRLYRYRDLLSTRTVTKVSDLMHRLEISAATLKRDIRELKNTYGYPIKFDRFRAGYILDGNAVETELPGLYFSPDEILALVTIQQLLSQLEPGLLGSKLKPLQRMLSTSTRLNCRMLAAKPLRFAIKLAKMPSRFAPNSSSRLKRTQRASSQTPRPRSKPSARAR